MRVVPVGCAHDFSTTVIILDEYFPQACAVLSGSLSEGLSWHVAPLPCSTTNYD